MAGLIVYVRNVCIFFYGKERDCWYWKLHFTKLCVQGGKSHCVSSRNQGVEDMHENRNYFCDFAEGDNVLYSLLFQMLYLTSVSIPLILNVKSVTWYILCYIPYFRW